MLQIAEVFSSTCSVLSLKLKESLRTQLAVLYALNLKENQKPSECQVFLFNSPVMHF